MKRLCLALLAIIVLSRFANAADIASNKAAGAAAATPDCGYKPTGRIYIYAGIMLSQVTGGFASGFLYTRNVDPTVGLRIRF
jgi:hypothetical protein